ncbi:MAG: methyltransferase domain-containing protein [Gammaproteobacteria bacterium]|nr:methyltransferase domain-containing protein [Gammaproteobacteria bacterium]
MHYFLASRKDLRIPDGKLLHIAPETCLTSELRELASNTYVSCDLFRSDVNVQLNIEQMPFSDDAFDVIFCSHVLPEVEKDNLAIMELRRVLNPRGWALVSVPSHGENTTEVRPGDGHEAPPEFFRIYGSDFSIALTEQGFDVETVQLDEVLNQEQQTKMRVNRQTASAIYILRKI